MEHKQKIWVGTVFLVVGFIALFLFSSNVFTGNVAATNDGGTLYIRSSPSNAEIIIGNNHMNKATPSTLRLSAANYRVTLKKEGYEDYVNRSVIIRDGQRTEVSANLRSLSNGNINISTEMGGMGGYIEIYLDNIWKGSMYPIANQKFSYFISDVPRGEHVVKIIKALGNYDNRTRYIATQRVNVVPKETVLVRNLIYSLADKLYLKINNVADAIVYINEELAIKSDTTNYFIELPRGSYNLLVKREGFYDYKTTFNTNNGESIVYYPNNKQTTIEHSMRMRQGFNPSINFSLAVNPSSDLNVYVNNLEIEKGVNRPRQYSSPLSYYFSLPYNKLDGYLEVSPNESYKPFSILINKFYSPIVIGRTYHNERYVELTSASSSNTFDINVKTNPEGATVIFEGMTMGITTSDGLNVNINNPLMNYPYNITTRKQGYQGNSSLIYIYYDKNNGWYVDKKWTSNGYVYSDNSCHNLDSVNNPTWTC